MEALANVNQLGLCDLREDELRDVDGGGFLVVVAAVTAAVILFNTCEKAGEAVGKAIYHATH